jgi:hypothetical protein
MGLAEKRDLLFGGTTLYKADEEVETYDLTP